MTDNKYTLITEFTTPVIETKDGEKNRGEGLITQGRPYPTFFTSDGEPGWREPRPYDSQKIFLVLYWVDEENRITQERQVMELTDLDDDPKVRWPLRIELQY